MKILVTGAGGFIGRYLSKYMQQHNLTLISRNELDLTDSLSVKKYFQYRYYDALINCAGNGRYRVREIDSKIYRDNMLIYANLKSVQDSWGQLINIGSGAEFDLDKDIDGCRESEIWNRMPITDYGASKNMISRLCCSTDNTCVIRVFGCFDPDEPTRSALRQCHQQVSQNSIFAVRQDRWFDMISLKDLATVIHSMLCGKITDKDINAVYDQKYRLSDIFRLYCQVHDFDSSLIRVENASDKNYTGCSDRLTRSQVPLEGLLDGLKSYKL